MIIYTFIDFLSFREHKQVLSVAVEHRMTNQIAPIKFTSLSQIEQSHQ